MSREERIPVPYAYVAPGVGTLGRPWPGEREERCHVDGQVDGVVDDDQQRVRQTASDPSFQQEGESQGNATPRARSRWIAALHAVRQCAALGRLGGDVPSDALHQVLVFLAERRRLRPGGGNPGYGP